MDAFAADFEYEDILGGFEEGVARFSPSPVLRTAGEYYVWYTRTSFRSASRASIYYATSPDGINWTEQGKALTRNEKRDWDSGEVFCPTVMIANHFYWLFYIARREGPLDRDDAPTGLGLAFSESPTGPWERLILNPVLHPSHSPELNCYRIDAACVMRRQDDIWLYYACRDYGDQTATLRLAKAQSPDGPYLASTQRMSLPPFTQLALWPHAHGTAGISALIPGTGRVLFSNDGLTFTGGQEQEVPVAAAPFRQDAFAYTPLGPGVTWGICEGRDRTQPYLRRFTCNLGADAARISPIAGKREDD